jgi:hypothetical protein
MSRKKADNFADINKRAPHREEHVARGKARMSVSSSSLPLRRVQKRCRSGSSSLGLMKISLRYGSLFRRCFIGF